MLMQQNSSGDEERSRLRQRSHLFFAYYSRSLLAIMSFLAKGVEIPEAHLSAGWAEAFPTPNDLGAASNLPLRIRSQKDEPSNAFAAIKYQGH